MKYLSLFILVFISCDDVIYTPPDEENEFQVSIYPNPYNGRHDKEGEVIRFVTLAKLPTTCNITIYNAIGDKVRSIHKTSDLSFYTFDLKDKYGKYIDVGVYKVKIISGSNVQILNLYIKKKPFVRGRTG